MKFQNKYLSSSKTVQKQSHTRRKRHTWTVIVIALYITFIILSTIAFSADRVVETTMKDTYTYNLRFNENGEQTHYYVELENTSNVGTINVEYTTSSNSLEVESKNINVLHIDCRSMYEDECRKVFGIDPTDNTNYYKWYFTEKDHLNVNVDSTNIITELIFKDTPMPSRVVVNGLVWKEESDYNFINNFGTILSNVPKGKTNVDIYFKTKVGNPPTAKLITSKYVASINETITFDASKSFDLDGEITTHIFDFGDGTFGSGELQIHSYLMPGVYGVILTVRDDDYLVDRQYINITIVETTNIPKIQGIVPNQERPEDSAPWTLDLEPFKPIARTPGTEFYWYLMGLNSSLYSVLGENNTDDELTFYPKPDAYGSDLVKLWLSNSDGYSVYQPLWINITSVNDPPEIANLPDLIVHYDDPYTFNFEPYVNDKETSKDDLILTVYDGYTENYVTINGLSAKFNYPHELVGQIIYATIIVSDSENKSQRVISIGVTSDHVPKLVKELPDITLYEGTTKSNVLDLDDYFTDPDDDSIFFTYGYTHLSISINKDHTIDITADSDWTGTELVTFRARDPVGALAEDSMLVTVLPVNDPPIIAGVPDFYIRFNSDYRFDLTPYIADNDNSTSELKIIVSDPEHIRLDIRNNLVIIFNYPEEYLGQSIRIILTVSDGLASDFQEITVMITDDYPPELINPIPDIVFLEDEPHINALDLNNYFLDVDGDVLYYTTGNKHISIQIEDNHLVSFYAPNNWFGSESMYVRATDPTGALQEDLILVTVLPVNDPPKIIDIPTQTVNESQRMILGLEKYIIDIDNNLTTLVVETDSDYVLVSNTDLIFLGSPDMPKHVELTVSDGQYKVSTIIDIELQLKDPPESTTFWEMIQIIIPYILVIIILIVIIELAVFRKRSSFDVEEVFLIHIGGTLINHLIKHSQANVDDVIFSGMFTAVQDFIHDTFGTKESCDPTNPDDFKDNDNDNDDNFDNNKNAAANNCKTENNWVLDELKLGDKKILIERSKNAYLAVIFNGEGSKWLRKKVRKLLMKIEAKYSEVLPTWDGDVRELSGVKEILKVLIKPDKMELTKRFKKETPPKEKSTIYHDNRVIVTQNIAQKQSFVQPQSSTSEDKTEIRDEIITNYKQINSEQMQNITQENDSKSSKNEEIENKNGTVQASEDEVGMGKIKPVKIKMPNTNKEFELDPTKSILEQLAAMDDFDDGWPIN